MFCRCGLSRFLESHWFVWATQISHIPMQIDLDQRQDWASMQVYTQHTHTHTHTHTALSFIDLLPSQREPKCLHICCLFVVVFC